MAVLSNIFGDQIVSRKLWPASSLNMNHCLPVGRFEGNAYKNNPHTQAQTHTHTHTHTHKHTHTHTHTKARTNKNPHTGLI